MTGPELQELREQLDSVRRALRAAERLQRIARQGVAQIFEQLDAIDPECSAQGGHAHDDRHTARV